MLVLLQVTFWLAVAVIAYTFLGYPLLIGLLARIRPHPVRQAEITPPLTLLIPAYNEAAVIARKLENSLGLDYPAHLLEVVVVADGSSDETVDIVSSYAPRGVCLYHQPERRGKAAAINRVMPLLSGEIVVFTDANTLIERQALRRLVRNFADPTVGGVNGEKRVLNGGEGLYWRYESFLKRCDSAVTSVMGAAGEFFAIRRELFQPPEEDSIIEDFVTSLRLVAAGWRVVYEAEAVAREEASPSLAGDWRRRTRIAAGGFQAIGRLRCLLSPAHGLVAWQYVSHRVLRWAVTPFLLAVVYALNPFLLGLPFYRLLFGAQTAFYASALLGYILTRLGRRGGPLQAAFYFCFANAAAWAGFWRYITGRQPVTWEKAR
ncbi:MAG: glycosyltransferase family 2 protein [Anaerolineae bacterium]|nr:glycosyltransferase family 2 protein [Anaerolineae bacterium]